MPQQLSLPGFPDGPSRVGDFLTVLEKGAASLILWAATITSLTHSRMRPPGAELFRDLKQQEFRHLETNTRITCAPA